MTVPNFKTIAQVRMWDWAVASIVSIGLVWWVAPQQLGVILFKCCLVAIAACLAFWVDHSLFKRAQDRVEGSGTIGAGRDLYSSMCLIRRAMIFMACVLGLALGV